MEGRKILTPSGLQQVWNLLPVKDVQARKPHITLESDPARPLRLVWRDDDGEWYRYTGPKKRN
ncbi:hypothetical protein [Ktedonospora formicarum]|uniref:hypothetical protein n=1 Tax=Ktedonospora formicarum TaxID=2778364 RepID=UPI001C68CCBE|nr:hypothetical protein [Ktedonospora formicarum]